MTAQQPQPEHCEHECVCDDYHHFHPEYNPDYQEVCNNKDCEHDTRTRPHTPAPEEYLSMDELFAHARAEAARAATLATIMKLWEEVLLEDVEKLGYIDIDSIEAVFIRAGESLRQQAGEQE